ncbi:hypothetical protein BS78_06G259200 [Paspalum vaginatum]|nr:hypothetical protein BS78_06G259200 [Paspalum vaginatum]
MAGAGAALVSGDGRGDRGRNGRGGGDGWWAGKEENAQRALTHSLDFSQRSLFQAAACMDSMCLLIRYSLSACAGTGRGARCERDLLSMWRKPNRLLRRSTAGASRSRASHPQETVSVGVALAMASWRVPVVNKRERILGHSLKKEKRNGRSSSGQDRIKRRQAAADGLENAASSVARSVSLAGTQQGQDGNKHFCCRPEMKSMPRRWLRSRKPPGVPVTTHMRAVRQHRRMHAVHTPMDQRAVGGSSMSMVPS